MKTSISLSVIIVVAGACLAWHDYRQLTSLRASHGQLVAEAAKLGIASDAGHPAAPGRITKHERGNREAAAKLVAAEVIAFAKEMEAAEKAGGKPDDAMQKRVMDLLERVMALDAAQLKIVIAEVRADKSLKDETRQGVIGFAIMTLANDHPQAALTLFTESADLFNDKEHGMGGHVVASALARWATDDPLAALDWARKNAEKYPELVTDQAKQGMIAGAARQDPRLAFKLIGELGLKEANDAIQSIVSVARTPEERTATLAALREHLATIKDDKTREEASNRALGMLVSGVARDGFESASKWLATANLTPAELTTFAGGLNIYSLKGDETGRWVEWLGQTIPAGKADSNIRNLVNQWTQKDYQAAGKWLTTTPDGPAKNLSIRSYAETVAPYDPETAAQWALTLPAGNERQATLKTIYHRWPKDDPAASAAATAFAAQHGIK